MQKKFITNLAFLLFLNLLIKPFWILGIDRAVQNTVGAQAYGDYYALFNFSFLLNIFLDLGITNFNNRNISQNRHLLSKHLAGIVVLRLLLALSYCIISLIIGLCIGYSKAQLMLLGVLLLNQILISFILYLRSNISGLHMFKTDSVISVLDRFIMIVICSVLLWGKVTETKFRIEWFVAAQTFAYVITVLFTLIVLGRKVKFERLNWNKAFFLMILKQSYPFAMLILLMTFYNRIDSVMIERLLPDGATQAGIYAQAYRLLDASNMISYLFAGLLLPMFSHMLKNKQPVEQLVKLSFSLIAVPAIIAGAASYIYKTEIMGLLYHQHETRSSEIFGVLMICFFAISTTYIFGTLLTANGSLKQLNLMAFAGMILNVSLNLYFIPRYYGYGASISGLVTQVATAAFQVVLSARIFKMKYNFVFIGKLLLFAIITWLGLYYFKSLSSRWIYSIIISSGICFSIAFLLRLISIKSIYYIIKYE